MNEIIGHYRIHHELGRGSLGTVYAAEDLALGRNVALKVFFAEALEDPENFNRFMTEARILAAINHPNIVLLYEVGKSGSSYFIASELVNGESLRSRMLRQQLSLPETVDIAIQVAGALNAAHGAGIVHRDVKPENIMLRGSTGVKIADFGVAKMNEWRSRSLIRGRQIDVRQASYLSPEEVLTRGATASTDIWRLGVLLSEMASRRTPFEKKTTSETIDSILKDNPAKLTRRLPSDLDQIVTKALQKPESARYGSAEEMASDLNELRSKMQQESRRHFPFRRRRVWDRLFGRRPAVKEMGWLGVSAADDAPDILYINLWLENEDKTILSTPAVLTNDTLYLFMFAIEKWSREDNSQPFIEPPELRDASVTKVVIELLCPFLEDGGEMGYVTREVNYQAGVGFPPETFNLKPDKIGRFYLTARLLMKGETIYREVLSLEVVESESNPKDNRADAVLNSYD